DDVFTYESENQVFHAPRTLVQLAELRAQYPDARILAGSTDVGLWVTKQMRDLPHLIYVGQVAELREIREEDGALYIGAGALLDDAFGDLLPHFGELDELVRRFASLPIRNAGTLGGNVANGSPIGDSMPALIALGTRIVLRRNNTVRDMPLEDFYLAYQKTALQPGEFVQGMRVPLPAAGQHFRTYKLSKRFDQDISAVCAAFAIVLDGETIREARIAFGGVAATPQRASQAEQVLVGQPWNETTALRAMEALQQDYTPLSDMRATNDYRLAAAANLLYRFYLETRPLDPLSAQQTSVFAQPVDA
ncbi:MAG TPA: FAD binding domain-containing protein, partial [Burkholderiaceae bacterium]|nr:FAD binding domain-containing protein [Burkholderiaceae bacterium]